MPDVEARLRRFRTDATAASKVRLNINLKSVSTYALFYKIYKLIYSSRLVNKSKVKNKEVTKRER